MKVEEILREKFQDESDFDESIFFSCDDDFDDMTQHKTEALVHVDGYDAAEASAPEASVLDLNAKSKGKPPLLERVADFIFRG